MFKTKKRLFLKLFLQFFRYLAWPDPKSQCLSEFGGNSIGYVRMCFEKLFYVVSSLAHSLTVV